jgi:uncharacterized protein YbjT (DUF2867 family)
MRILLLGASGFIGRELFAALEGAGHRVVAAVRDPARAPPFAFERPITIDMNRDVAPGDWIERLAGIDAVVNCAGILQSTRSQSMDAIHRAAPIALFQACLATGVRRVVQVSAISADADAGTEYAATKLAADDFLRASALEWVVLRPSLVHARGAYGGTAFFRAIAALPFAIPVPGEGGQQFQPIHVGDLARVVLLALESDRLVGWTVSPVGPEAITLRAILEDLRRWLGFARAPIVEVPPRLVAAAAALGDRLGGSLNSTALAQLEHGNAGDYEAFTRATGLAARRWKESLAREPAHAQDRWHARLYFVRPMLRYALAFLWLASGIAGMLDLRAWAVLIARELAIGIGAAIALLALACALDILIAALVAKRWRPPRVALLQAALILGYTAAATLLFPTLWIEPLGPLFKNVPILAAALAWGAIEDER